MTVIKKVVRREIPTRPPLRRPLVVEIGSDGVLRMREKGARIVKVEIEIQALYVRLVAAKVRSNEIL